MSHSSSSKKPFNPALQEGAVSSRAPLTWHHVETFNEDNLETEITSTTLKKGMCVYSFCFRQYKLSGFPTKFIALTPEDIQKVRTLLDRLERYYAKAHQNA